jgi:hypothetical protein
MKRIGFWLCAIALAWIGGAPGAQACATCFGASDAPMAQGMNAGIFALLGVIGFVLTGVVTFFGYLAWRMSRLGNAELNEDMPMLGESTRTSWR